MFLVVLLLMVAIFFIQAPSLYVNRLWKDLAVFILFWGVASLYAVTALGDYLFPAPSQVVISVLHFIYRFLGIKI